MLIGSLSPGDRQKIMTICTIEVHNRDVVSKLISQRVENAQAFTWLSQVRHRWDDNEQDCFANICDAQFRLTDVVLATLLVQLDLRHVSDRFDSRPTQPPTLSGTGNEYRPKCGDALRLGSKCRYGSFHLWINVWVAGKTV